MQLPVDSQGSHVCRHACPLIHVHAEACAIDKCILLAVWPHLKQPVGVWLLLCADVLNKGVTWNAATDATKAFGLLARLRFQ